MKGVLTVGVGALVFLRSAIASACSGPDALARIERAEVIGWVLLAASAAIAIGGVAWLNRTGRMVRYAAAVIGALLVSHPGWWMSARDGDCGQTRVATAIFATVALAAVVGVLASRKRG
ncbi:MAG: hypothetical protein NVSMB47_07150 [Polyangiales bacterium]